MSNNKGKVFGVVQRIGRSFMLPIALLPIAGILLGIGASFTNEATIAKFGLENILGAGTILHSILTVMKNAGDIIFANLPIIFAIGVSIGMAKQERGVAALSGVIAYLVMNTTINAMLQINGLLLEGALPSGSVAPTVGIMSLQMGVFGGIIVGLGVAALHNKFYNIELPQVIAFFGGTRFVPIISSVVYIFVGILLFFVWPYVQSGILWLGNLVNVLGYAGTFVYGLIERSLIPFGLHHVFYTPFWQTAVGGEMVIGGQLIQGAQNIFFAQLADPGTTEFSVSAARFMAGKFPFMMFGLGGAALAMYTSAKANRKKTAGALLLAATITAFLTGITEPLEFTFLFVAPILYAIHAVFAGLSFMLMHILGVAVGQTFSGGFIDFMLFGVLQGNDKTNWIWIPIVGIFYFILYFIVFKFFIVKFNLKTPGREDDNEETKLYTRKDVDFKTDTPIEAGVVDDTTSLIIQGLGGKDNIIDADCCATRLRVTVKEASLVDKDMLKRTGAAGVIGNGTAIQVVYGPQVNVITSKVKKVLEF